MWGLYVDYSSSAGEHISVMWEASLFRGICQLYACMYSSVFGHIVDFIEVI